MLTIVGFSVHDTIVVFDRLRENIHRSEVAGLHVSVGQAVNASLNQTLARSLNTSITVVLVLVALILLGGDTIREFLLIMLMCPVPTARSSSRACCLPAGPSAPGRDCRAGGPWRLPDLRSLITNVLALPLRLPGVSLERNVEFGRARDRPLRLNLLLPKQRKAAAIPAVIYIFGGGWRGGNYEQGMLVSGADRGLQVRGAIHARPQPGAWPGPGQDRCGRTFGGRAPGCASGLQRRSAGAGGQRRLERAVERGAGSRRLVRTDRPADDGS
jgi:hypothetical protein